ncbi:MAG TPA: hypothetical protein PK843_06865 [bacterium]|nr:hypothetical protein [bacterium]
MLKSQDIKDRTEEYWEYKCDYDCYIRELLGRELAEARNQDSTRLHGLAHPVHALAMTVGDSFEPLIQTVCVLKPQRLILILNRKYGDSISGMDHGRELCRLVKMLGTVPTLPSDLRPSLTDNYFDIFEVPQYSGLPWRRAFTRHFDLIEIAQDTPTEVFRSLLLAFQAIEAQPPKEFMNAVDITGAKKSMVVGAFLYAVHSRLPITYVDFDKYNSSFHRPYGYTCRIGQIADPYQAFQLRDWERVIQLYNRYNFREARELVLGIQQVMAQHLDGENEYLLYEPTDIERVTRLVRVFDMYGAWENGDYRKAKAIYDAFSPSLPKEIVPSAILVLGSFWPSTSDEEDPGKAAHKLLHEHIMLKRGNDQLASSIFSQPIQLLSYVRDELAKVKRLVSKNEDFRSAYLRTAGLHEFLLKARLALCWLNDGLEVKPKGETDWKRLNSWKLDQQRRAFEDMLEESNEWKLRKTLKSSPPTEYNVSGGNVRRSNTAPVLQAYSAGHSLDLDTPSQQAQEVTQTPIFIKLRGEAIHTHLYISNNISEAAISLVTQALKEFEVNWLEHFHAGSLQAANDQIFECPSWARLCDTLKLDFLPPKLRN